MANQSDATGEIVQLTNADGTKQHYPRTVAEALVHMDGTPARMIEADENGNLPAGALPEHTHSMSQITGDLAADRVSGVLGVDHGGTGAETAQGARVSLETAKPIWGEVTLLANGWTQSGTVFVQTVACDWAKETLPGRPHFAPSYSTDETANEALDEAAALIRYIDTADGSITARTKGADKPQINLPLIYDGEVE